MKKTYLIILILFSASLTAFSQKKLNVGAGLTLTPGIVAEFEIEKFFTDDLSLPLRSNASLFAADGYNALTVDVHKGFRKYFNSGLFVEQSVGIGAVVNFFEDGTIWYTDDYSSTVASNDKAVFGVIPSATLGVGYNITNKNETQNLIWMRPKIYWNLGIRSFNLPYFMLQVGYTYNIK